MLLGFEQIRLDTSGRVLARVGLTVIAINWFNHQDQWFLLRNDERCAVTMILRYDVTGLHQTEFVFGIQIPVNGFP
jgi:hypothetical protein